MRGFFLLLLPWEMTYFSELAKVLASSSVSGPHPAPVMSGHHQKSQSESDP